MAKILLKFVSILAQFLIKFCSILTQFERKKFRSIPKKSPKQPILFKILQFPSIIWTYSRKNLEKNFIGAQITGWAKLSTRLKSASFWDVRCALSFCCAPLVESSRSARAEVHKVKNVNFFRVWVKSVMKNSQFSSGKQKTFCGQFLELF